MHCSKMLFFFVVVVCSSVHIFRHCKPRLMQSTTIYYTQGETVKLMKADLNNFESVHIFYCALRF